MLLTCHLLGRVHTCYLLLNPNPELLTPKHTHTHTHTHKGSEFLLTHLGHIRAHTHARTHTHTRTHTHLFLDHLFDIVLVVDLPDHLGFRFRG
jgi:hypothetical protein